MSFLEKSLFCLLAVTFANILISVHGASIAQSVSVSVSSSSESKSEEKTVVDNAASSRSLKSDESFKNEVEISPPYARKLINNFSSEDKSRSLKEPSETIQKNEEQITTEKPEGEREVTTEFNQFKIASENVMNQPEFDSENRTLKEPVENISKSDESITTEKSHGELEVTAQPNESHVKNENAVEKIEIDQKSQGLKESNEDTSKSDRPITTEKTVSEQEVDSTLNQSTETDEIVIKTIKIEHENQTSIESSETTTIAAVTTSEREEQTTTKTTEETTKNTEESKTLIENDEAAFSEKSYINFESDSTEAVTESTQPNLASENYQTERMLKRRSLKEFTKSMDMKYTDKIHFEVEPAPPQIDNRWSGFTAIEIAHTPAQKPVMGTFIEVMKNNYKIENEQYKSM